MTDSVTIQFKFRIGDRVRERDCGHHLFKIFERRYSEREGIAETIYLTKDGGVLFEELLELIEPEGK